MHNRQNQQLRANRKVVITLIVGLLLAQWLVFTHVHDQASKTPDSLCSVCLTGEHFNHALANSQVIIATQPVVRVVLTVFIQIIPQPFFTAFRSRAPPVSL